MHNERPLLPKQLEVPHTPVFMHSQSMEDTSMIDSNYCGYCGARLKANEETDLPDSDMPTYEEHVGNPMHIQKKMDYNKYNEFKGRDWDPLEKEIDDVISEVEQTKQPVTEVEECKQELDGLQHNLEQLKSQQNWGECSRLVEKSLAKFSGMLSRLKEKVQQLQLQQQQQQQQEHPSSEEQPLFQPMDDGAHQDDDDDQEEDEEFELETGDTRKQRFRKRKRLRQRR